MSLRTGGKGLRLDTVTSRRLTIFGWKNVSLLIRQSRPLAADAQVWFGGVGFGFLKTADLFESAAARGSSVGEPPFGMTIHPYVGLRLLFPQLSKLFLSGPLSRGGGRWERNILQ